MNESRVPLELAEVADIPRGMVLDEDEGVLNWKGEYYYRHRDRPIPPVTLRGGPRQAHSAGLEAYRDRLLAHRWDRVEPSTRIEPGTNARLEWDASDSGLPAGAREYLPLTAARYADPPGGRRWYVDPATVPAPDPDAELVDQLAKRMHDDSGCEDQWPCVASTRGDYQMWARDLIAAVREHDGTSR